MDLFLGQTGDVQNNLQINAWTGGDTVMSPVGPAAAHWAFEQELPRQRDFLQPPKPADLNCWADSQVGWGLILPYSDSLSKSDAAAAADAPEAIRYLRACRGDAPVFRYKGDSPLRFSHLYSPTQDKWLHMSASAPGLGPDCLPWYLLIYGSPEEIPWELQYHLNAARAVGRLDLEGGALENYVGALLDGWRNARARPDRAVIWAAYQGRGDVTQVMRNAIAYPIFDALSKDPDVGVAFLDGAQRDSSSQSPAGLTELGAALTGHSPGLIVTTSHGQTGPRNDLAAMRTTLGLPVDSDFQVLDPDVLLAKWEPDGAIWYAHACCSAGTGSTHDFRSLVQPDSVADQVLAAVGQLGSLTAPLPKALLGSPKPLRAFVGHVRPTFDWTLRHPATGQHLTASIRNALYEHLYRWEPIGQAFREYHATIGPLSIAHHQALNAFNQGSAPDDLTRYDAIACKLSWLDVQSLVILGDPTVALHALAPPAL
jgi:hypothetical protein